MARSLNVLYVEDNSLLAFDLEDMIWKSGHQPVGPARCYQSAMALADSMRIDVALIDLNLTDGHSGASIARHLGNRHIRIVVISDNQDIDAELAGTPHTFIAKPVPMDVLRSVIEGSPLGDMPSRMPEWPVAAPVVMNSLR